MSLPNYLAKIKSAGIYRFVWDKSQAPIQEAETLRLVVGYSEKGPFNTPVYIDNTADFKTIFGGINKKLEKRGVFFHRMALQALDGGPILALNLKRFDNADGESTTVKYLSTDVLNSSIALKDTAIENVYDTSRFWSIDPDLLPVHIDDSKYITIASTDSKTTSCSVFMRGYVPSGYDVTVKSWYASKNDEEMPAYLEDYQDMLISDFFAEIYVFRGEFTKAIATTEELKKYFDIVDDKVYVKHYITDAFGNKVDALEALADDENSNFVQKYQGILLPYFKDNYGTYISLDLIFNLDNSNHSMIMKLDSSLLDDEVLTPKDIATTGFDLVTESMLAEIIANPSDDSDSTNSVNILANRDILPSVSVAEYSSDDDGWNYTAHGDYINDVDLYMYPLDNDSLVGLDNEYADLGLAEGDRFVMKHGSDVVVTTLAHYTVDDAGLVSLVFADDEAKPFTVDGSYYLVKCNHSISDETSVMTPLFFEGYTLDESLVKPSNTSAWAKLQWQTNILNTITHYSGLLEALTNNTDLEYHYIVDTFESFVDAEVKSSLSLVCKKKDNSLGLLNFPSINTFANCDYTKFTDDEGFKIKYIALGGNKKKPIRKLFSLPSINNGASWCGFFTPVVLSDGTVKTTCPSAALVSNLFMEKYNSRKPYDIVAGPNYGHISADGLVGPDYNFSRADLDILEPFGVNCMVYVPRRGTQINSNQTAKQNPVSTLSAINVRELVIYLQDSIAEMLQNYQWEFNTATLRDNVKSKADTILDNVLANGGVYKYRNTCDESNNTDDVINNEMLVLSTEIEPARGAGKMVEELTLYRKGGMSSSAN